jgi:Prokaryotic E2 family A/ThiF family/Prokaryotic homologs of the JAB domain
VVLHPWLATAGDELTAGSPIELPAAREFVDLLARGRVLGASVVAVRQSATRTTVHLNIEVERPQDLAHDIKAMEPIAVVFPKSGAAPSVFALRDDFPETPHQNATPADKPASLCIDDRTWHEARLTYSPMDLVRRVQLWLAKAARGELHDRSLPPEPLFFPEPMSIILPSAAISPGGHLLPLSGYIRPDNKSLIIADVTEASEAGRPGVLTVLQYCAEPQPLSRMRYAPSTLAELADDLTGRGVNLLNDLKVQLLEWAGSNDKRGRLSSILVLLVTFPVQDEQGKESPNRRAFVSVQCAGDVGARLGVLFKEQPSKNHPPVYLSVLGGGKASPALIEILPAGIHLAFDREVAQQIAACPVGDTRRVALVGAGSIGSHIAINLAREGRFKWSVVDNDALLPHNLARHALLQPDVGAPKAVALAQHLSALLGEHCEGVKADVIAPGAEQDRVDKALLDAEVVIDTSASVAVSRHLSDLPAARARRVCAFFNPAGTAAVVLTEPLDRSVTLHDLEAQYFRLLLTNASLATHLKLPPSGVSYSGSCRSLTNRIPASKASILAALASRGIVDSLDHEHGSIGVWTLDDTGQVSHVTRRASAVYGYDRRWKVVCNEDLLNDLARLRGIGLPVETGGVLMGVVDSSRRTIHVAYAMPAPQDSEASSTGFERGVAGLLEAVSAIAGSTMHQLRYVGEWHSHPNRSSVSPSRTDLQQVAWLAREMSDDGFPAIMVIAGERDRFSIIIGDSTFDLSPQGRAA